MSERRWLVASKQNRAVAHLVDEVVTGWGRAEKAGSLVFMCGRDSNEAWAKEPSVRNAKCRRCWASLGEGESTEQSKVEFLDRSKMVLVEGVVYCHQLNEVHEDGINPYGMGPESYCDPREHRPVYYRARKGDYVE